MAKKASLLILIIFLFGSVSIQPALGKDYPTRPIEFLCPYTPCGVTDLTARALGEIASKYLGGTVVVVNKPGAGGSLAAADVISSPPDGHKIVWLTNIFFATTTKTQKIPFDPNDLIPLASIMQIKLGMMVKSDSPWKTLADLLDYARKNPGKLRWAHGGRGLTVHLNALLLFKQAGVETIDIPYKGPGEILSAVLGGHVDAMSQQHGSVLDQVKAGNLRYLVSYSDQRFSDTPNVPCTTELGFTDVGKLPTIFGVYAHKNTPEKIRETLINAFKKSYEDPELRKVIEKFMEEPKFGGPEFMKESVKKAEEAGVPLIKELGLYVGK